MLANGDFIALVDTFGNTMWQIVVEFDGEYYGESFIWSSKTKWSVQHTARLKYNKLKNDLMHKDKTTGIRAGIVDNF